jgi:hypothetical protein
MFMIYFLLTCCMAASKYKQEINENLQKSEEKFSQYFSSPVHLNDLFKFLDEKTAIELGITPTVIEEMKKRKQEVQESEKIGIVVFDSGVGAVDEFWKDNLQFMRNNLEDEVEEKEEETKTTQRLRKTPSIQDLEGYSQTPSEPHGESLFRSIIQVDPSAPLFIFRKNTEKKNTDEIAKSFNQLTRQNRTNIKGKKPLMSLAGAKIVTMSFSPFEPLVKMAKEGSKIDLQANIESTKKLLEILLQNNRIVIMAAGNQGIDFADPKYIDVARVYNETLKSLTSEQRNRIAIVGALELKKEYSKKGYTYGHEIRKMKFSNFCSKRIKDVNDCIDDCFIFAPGEISNMHYRDKFIKEWGGISLNLEVGTSIAVPLYAATLSRFHNEYSMNAYEVIKKAKQHREKTKAYEEQLIKREKIFQKAHEIEREIQKKVMEIKKNLIQALRNENLAGLEIRKTQAYQNAMEDLWDNVRDGVLKDREKEFFELLAQEEMHTPDQNNVSILNLTLPNFSDPYKGVFGDLMMLFENRESPDLDQMIKEFVEKEITIDKDKIDKIIPQPNFAENYDTVNFGYILKNCKPHEFDKSIKEPSREDLLKIIQEKAPAHHNDLLEYIESNDYKEDLERLHQDKNFLSSHTRIWDIAKRIAAMAEKTDEGTIIAIQDLIIHDATQ